MHLLLGLSSISFCCIYFSWHFPKIGHSIVSHFFSKWSGKAGTYPSENQLNRQAIFNTVYLMYVVCMFCNPVTKTWTCMILDSDSTFCWWWHQIQVSWCFGAGCKKWFDWRLSMRKGISLSALQVLFDSFHVTHHPSWDTNGTIMGHQKVPYSGKVPAT